MLFMLLKKKSNLIYLVFYKRYKIEDIVGKGII